MSNTNKDWSSNTQRRIESEILPELTNLHEKVMEVLGDTKQRLICGTYKPANGTKSVDLRFVNRLIDAYGEHLISWPQRLESSLKKMVEQARFESDSTYDINKLYIWQKREFLQILDKLKYGKILPS